MGAIRVLMLILGLMLLAGCSLTDVSTPAAVALADTPTPATAVPAKSTKGADGHAGPPQQASADSTATESPVRVVCNCQSLNIRSKAGDDIAAVGWLDVGAAVRVTGKRSGVWVEISSGGWVHGAYLCPVP